MFTYTVHNEDCPLTTENIVEFIESIKMPPEQKVAELWLQLPQSWIKLITNTWEGESEDVF